MKRRLLCLLLAVVMLVASLPLNVVAASIYQAQSNSRQTEQLPFNDVKKGAWYYDAVEYAYRHNLFYGTGIRTFAPLGTITRAMFVTVLGRMVGVDISKYQNKSTFSDVDNDAYYAPYVAWAVENGITTGTGNGLFSPDEPVNREQMAVFMVRLFEALGISLSETDETDLPKDFDSISDYAKEAVLKLWNGGMFQGDSKGRFNPKNNATRAECASFLMRIDELLVQIGYKKYVTEEKQEEKPVVIIGGGGTNPGQEPGEEPGEETYTVTFKDGSRVVDTLTAVKDQPLGTVPGADKTAKQNAIFVGWFKDPGLTEPFYYDYPVTEDLTVYAKYTELQSETLNITSFAQLDQGPDLSFEIVRSEDAGTLPEDAFTLIPKDGSDPIPLTWTVNGNVYTVSAVGGFKEGSSYELTLADGYSFKDKPETVRTASFSIAKEEVKNLEMSDGIIYIRDTDELDYVIGEKVYEVLVPSLVSTKNGTFVYEYADTLNVNDIICFYINTKPTDRDYMNFSYHDDPEVYVKVLGVSGDNTVTFGPLGDDEMAVLYKIPDNFPIIVPTLPTEDTGVVNINQLDVDTYIMIMGADGTLEKAKDRVNVGDFISLYVSPDSVTDEDSVYFGEVTGYNKDTGEISYKRTTKEAIESSMDLYVTPDITGDDLISPEEKALIEEQLYAQIKKSGFAEDAAFLLADMAAKTKGFRELDGIQVFFKDENGNPLSYEEIELLNIGKSFELSDDVELTVELITKGDRLHFKDGVQLAVGIDAEFETETEDEGKIVIHLSAAFTEEVALGVNVKGDLVWKKILFFIPVPIGVSVSSSIDIKNFSAVSFNINIYTVEKEEESTWEKVKGLLEDTQVGPILKQIEEVQNKIDQAKGTAEQLAGYYSDLEALWNSIPSDKTDKEEWKQLGETLGKTNITKDLLELMDLSLDTELEAGLYAQSIRELMEKYSEMLQTETDWVKLVDQKMFGAELCILGVAISTSVNFVVRADVNIAMGSSLEYEVGKRYIFWFKIGLFKPSAGTETMDLMDERFAFQFYVMGKIGMKMGIAASIEVGIGSSKLASVGITAEMGPYIKLYGFFVYEYEKLRPANTSKWIYDERMAGALYLDFGMYFVLSFDAQALGNLFEYSYDFINEEVPLLEAGERLYPYAFSYEPEEGELIRIIDADGNSTNGISMHLPESLLALSYIDLTNGLFGSKTYNMDRYNITFSSPYFSLDDNGRVVVDVPEGAQYLECNVTITYTYGKLAFSKYDMTITVPLVWTNLSDAELNEYYTASVRVGNDTDGYQTVWRKRVRKNQEFDLPTIEEIKELIKYDRYDNGSGINMKYESFFGYDVSETESLKIYTDTTYDIQVVHKTYSVTVNDIQLSDGTTVSRTYTTQYGKAFDFSDLKNTGKNILGDTLETTEFTVFAGLTAEKEGSIGENELPTYDLTAPVEGKLALDIAAGKVKPKAEYVDNSVLVTFRFDGLAYPDIIQKIKKGTEPNLNAVEAIVSDNGLAIKDITPILGKVFSNITYTVACGELTGPKTTITFESNGGTEVPFIEKVVGSLIGILPTPAKYGYTFEGWYTDQSLTTPFGLTKMPSENMTLYAKWSANVYRVVLNANGGAFEGDAGTKEITVTFGTPYGDLAAPTRSGKGFVGWFTDPEGGTEVLADTVVDAAGDHILYARWVDLIVIGNDVFSFVPVVTTYMKGVSVPANIIQNEAYAGPEGFTFEYRMQNDPNAAFDAPVGAGTYDLVVKRPGDNVYAPFEYRYEGVVIINKAVRTLEEAPIEAVRRGYTFLELGVVENGIDDLSDMATIVYYGSIKMWNFEIDVPFASGTGYIDGIVPGSVMSFKIEVRDDPNYENARSKAVPIQTLPPPTESWLDHTEPVAVVNGSVTVSTAGQLAYLAKEINSGNLDSRGLQVTLANDIDLTGYLWEPIGNTENTAFKGDFYGDMHTVSGMYADGIYSGLFGITDNALLENVQIKESYVYGLSAAGSIAGVAWNNSLIRNCVNRAIVTGENETGGIVGILGQVIFWLDGADFSKVDGCINYGNISGVKFTGGIVGRTYTYTYIGYTINRAVINCINYGNVSGGTSVGGIAGAQIEGYISNNVNFGWVSGETNVGGIVGLNSNYHSVVENCYSAGTVEGYEQYIGAVVGRNENDNGKVNYCYYRAGSATCDEEVRYGLGTKNGSVPDGDKGYKVASFTSYDSSLSKDYGYGKTNLLTVLNAYVQDNGGEPPGLWSAGPDGYPIPCTIQWP